MSDLSSTEGKAVKGQSIPSKDVCAQDRANDVAKMGDVVHVGQCAGDENVALPFLGQDLFVDGDHVSRIAVLEDGQDKKGQCVVGC